MFFFPFGIFIAPCTDNCLMTFYSLILSFYMSPSVLLQFFEKKGVVFIFRFRFSVPLHESTNDTIQNPQLGICILDLGIMTFLATPLITICLVPHALISRSSEQVLNNFMGCLVCLIFTFLVPQISLPSIPRKLQILLTYKHHIQFYLFEKLFLTFKVC